MQGPTDFYTEVGLGTGPQGWVRSARIQIRLQIVGDRLFVAFMIDEGSGTNRLPPWHYTVEIRRGAEHVIANMPAAPDPALLAALAAQAGVPMRRLPDSGVWAPKFQPGDVVLVDRPNADHVKVIDPQLQVSERLGKQRTTIAAGDCTCPMTALLTSGCPRSRGAGSCFTGGTA